MNALKSILLTLLWLVAGDAAVAAHITDKLVVGIYAQPSSEGSPLKLLSSGTPLEVVKRQEGYSEVRLADDTKGWVANTYITEEKPAKAMLLETQAKLRQMGLELAGLREKQANAEAAAEKQAADQPLAPSDQTTADDDARPSAREAQLRQALDKAEARVGELEQQIAGLERRLAERPVDEGAQQRLDDLQQHVQRALEVLVEAQGLKLTQADPPPAGLIGRYQHWIIGAITLLVGFGAGVWFLDYRIRRRYGGFRI